MNFCKAPSCDGDLLFGGKRQLACIREHPPVLPTRRPWAPKAQRARGPGGRVGQNGLLERFRTPTAETTHARGRFNHESRSCTVVASVTRARVHMTVLRREDVQS